MKPENNYFTAKSRFIAALIAAGFAVLSIGFEERRVNRIETEMSTYARLIEAMHDTRTGVIEVMMGDKAISSASEGAEDIFGYTMAELKGLPVENLVPVPFLDDHRAGFDAATKTSIDGTMKRRVLPVRCNAKKKDGTEVPVIIRVYIGKHSIIALVNKDTDSEYIPISKMEDRKKETK